MESNRSFKQYFISLRFSIFFSVFIFLFAIFFGYFLAKNSPTISQSFLDQLIKIFRPIIEGPPLLQFFFIFFKNSLTIFLIILAGILFGILPSLSLFINGQVLGMIFFLSQSKMPLLIFLKATLPHGIIEIPVIIVGSAMGLDLGKLLILRVFFKRKENIKGKFNTAFNFFIKVLVPFLLLAAAIESFFVPKTLGI